MDAFIRDELMEHSEICAQYHVSIVEMIFDSMSSAIDSIESGGIQLSRIRDAVARDLSKLGIACIGLDALMHELMLFVCAERGTILETPCTHRDAVADIARDVLSEYIDDPDRYADELAGDVVDLFSGYSRVSSMRIVDDLLEIEQYRDVPQEALALVVDRSFDFFVDLGLISTD